MPGAGSSVFPAGRSCVLPVGPGDKCYPCGGLGDSIIISFSLGGTAYYKGGGRNILAG